MANNEIGIGLDEKTVVFNSGNGVFLNNDGGTLGGSNVIGPGNLISGNQQSGVLISEPTALVGTIASLATSSAPMVRATPVKRLLATGATGSLSTGPRATSSVVRSQATASRAC